MFQCCRRPHSVSVTHQGLSWGSFLVGELWLRSRSAKLLHLWVCWLIAEIGFVVFYLTASDSSWSALCVICAYFVFKMQYCKMCVLNNAYKICRNLFNSLLGNNDISGYHNLMALIVINELQPYLLILIAKCQMFSSQMWCFVLLHVFNITFIFYYKKTIK